MSFDPSNFTSLDAAMGAALDESYRLSHRRSHKMKAKALKRSPRTAKRKHDPKVYGTALRMRSNEYPCTLPKIVQAFVMGADRDKLIGLDEYGCFWERHMAHGKWGSMWTRMSAKAKDATSDNPPPKWTPTFFANKPLAPFLEMAEEALEEGNGVDDLDIPY